MYISNRCLCGLLLDSAYCLTTIVQRADVMTSMEMAIVLFPCHGPPVRYVKLRFAHAPGMPGTVFRHRGLAIPTCITARVVMHAGIVNQRFPYKSVAGKTFPAFAAHANPQFYVSGKRPMSWCNVMMQIMGVYVWDAIDNFQRLVWRISFVVLGLRTYASTGLIHVAQHHSVQTDRTELIRMRDAKMEVCVS